MQCQNNLKQMSLAVHNFHDSNGRFPASAFDPIAVGKNVSSCGVIPLLLPFIEQEPLYSGLMIPYTAGASGDVGQQNLRCRTIGHNVRINTFICPSDGNSNIKVKTPTDFEDCDTVTSYRGSRADLAGSDATNYDMSAVNPTTQYPMQRSWLRAGRFVGGFELVTDGTSNSVMFSEGIIHDGKGGMPGVNFKANCATGVSAYYNCVPQNCLNLKGAGNRFANPTQPTLMNAAGHNLGRRAWYTYSHNVHFHTLLPPNSPSCHSGWIYVWVSASSNHSGGVNVSMLDASVKFVTDTIHTANLSRKVTSQSPEAHVTPAYPYDDAGTFSYGLWSELGSINGGEAATLP
jgi:prepilin-type processing-associated H-X9-DG protein